MSDNHQKDVLSFALSKHVEKLSCPICKELFSLPMTLERCKHTFCASCLNAHVKTFEDDKKRNCPRCKGPVTRESDWDGTGEVAKSANREIEEIVETWKKYAKAAAEATKTTSAEGEDAMMVMKTTTTTDSAERREEEEEEEEIEKIDPVPPPTKYHLLPKAKQAEKTRKTAELRDDLENKYGFNGKILKTQTYEDLKAKYVTFRDRYNTELRDFKRVPDMKSIVENMESIETAIREENDKAAKRVNKAAAFFDRKAKKTKPSSDEGEIDQELMKKLVEQADASMQGKGLQKKREFERKKNVVARTTTTVEETIEISSDEEEEIEPLPLSQPNLKYVESSDEEEEDIVRTQEEVQ
jgi:hypothetical protein